VPKDPRGRDHGGLSYRFRRGLRPLEAGPRSGAHRAPEEDDREQPSHATAPGLTRRRGTSTAGCSRGSPWSRICAGGGPRAPGDGIARGAAVGQGTAAWGTSDRLGLCVGSAWRRAEANRSAAQGRLRPGHAGARRRAARIRRVSHYGDPGHG
jgi:hypothetical protein